MLNSVLILLAASCVLIGPSGWAKSFAGLSGKDLISDQTFKLDPSPARPTVIVFVSARCPCSTSHEKMVKELAEQKKDFAFVAVHSNADESPIEAQKHFAAAAMGIPVIDDSQGEWAAHFQALKTPHAFIVDRDGQLLYSGGVTDSSQAGDADKLYLKDTLDELQSTGKIKESRRRALGCIIKRRNKS